MCFGTDKTRHPAQPIAKQNAPDARRVHPKDSPGNLRLPNFYFNTHCREFTYQNPFFIKKSNLMKERGKSKWHSLQRQ